MAIEAKDPNRSQESASCGTDIEALYQTTFESKHVTDHFICEEFSIEIAHDLMDFDDDFSLLAMGELEWGDMRIKQRPLACPIIAHSIASVDMTAFHPIRPHHVLVQSREDPVYVAGVKPIIDVL